MDTSELREGEFSIVLRDVTSLRHNYSNVNPRFLALAEVIPDAWEVEVFLPSHKSTRFSAIRYMNGVYLMGDNDSFVASHNPGFELGKRPELSYRIMKYIESLAPETFDKAEMRWELYLERKNPAKWIMSRFFRPGLIPKDWKEPQAIPSFSFRSNDADVFYRFSVDEESKFVTINCQAHSASPIDDVGISEWLSNYHDHETAMLTNLIQLAEA